MWALIGWLFVLAVTVNMTKSWMVAAAAAGGGEYSRLWLHDTHWKRKSVSITGMYVTLCVAVCKVLKMYPADDWMYDV